VHVATLSRNRLTHRWLSDRLTSLPWMMLKLRKQVTRWWISDHAMPSWEFSFCFFFISYVYICMCIRWHLKETIASSSITWSEMGKQNIQAKEVYWHAIVSEVYFCLVYLTFIIIICLIFFYSSENSQL